MGYWLWWEAGLLPSAFAVGALAAAALGRSRPWRARMRALIGRLGKCVVAFCALACLALALRASGIAGASGPGCQPSPNGWLCEGE